MPLKEWKTYVLDIHFKQEVAGKLQIQVYAENSRVASGTQPKNYKIHTSNFSGLLTRTKNDFTLPSYSAYTIEFHSVAEVFQSKFQHWNEKYDKAVQIFGSGAPALAIRGIIHTQHSNLYKEWKSSQGKLFYADDFFRLFDYGERNQKRRVFTYVLMDDGFRCSETGSAFFRDFLSKHALHSNAAKEVRFSGEFHIQPSSNRPLGHKLIIDNNSGTYSPSKEDLPLLEQLFKINFPDIEIETYDREDPKLLEYLKTCMK